jgi:hypothetical protein
VATLLVDDRDRAATLALERRRSNGEAQRSAASRDGVHGSCSASPATARSTPPGNVRRGSIHYGRRTGRRAPPAFDAPYLRLYELVVHTPPNRSPASLSSMLPRGDYRDAVFAHAVLEHFMYESGYSYATPAL